MSFKTAAQKIRSFPLRVSVKLLLFLTLDSILVIVGAAALEWQHGLPGRTPAQLRLFSLFAMLYLVLFGILIFAEMFYLYRQMRRLEAIFHHFQRNEGGGPSGYPDVKGPIRIDKAFEEILDRQKISLQRKHQEEMLRRDVELSSLISQINPHFLYNTLDSIRGYAVLHHVEEIADLTESLSTLFRNVISHTEKCVSLREELEIVRHYMKIQQFRFKDKFLLDLRFEENDSLLDCMLLNLTLQPLVENAIFHGLEDSIGQGTITISGYSTESRLVITVSDNGAGMEGERVNLLNDAFSGRCPPPPSSHSGHTGIALININKRIQLNFGENYGLKVMSTVGVGTDVEAVLPLLRGRQEIAPGFGGG